MAKRLLNESNIDVDFSKVTNDKNNKRGFCLLKILKKWTSNRHTVMASASGFTIPI